MNQNFYNSNSSSFDQSQPPQFPVIHSPPQETSIETLHDQENKINSVQTFLRKFNRISFFETPKVLLLAWDKIFKIKDAFGNKQYKPEETQELFRELFNDVQNIHEELAEYINTPGWNRPAFYKNGDDDDEDCTIAITSDFLIMDSLGMRDERLDTIPKKESDEFLKSSVEDLVPNPSEFEDECECDVPNCDDSQMTHFSTFSNPHFDNSTSSDDESIHEEDIHEMSFKTYSNPLFDLDEEIISSKFNLIHNEDLDSTLKNDCFDTKSYLLESLLNHDESIPPGIDCNDSDSEGDNLFLERLLHDDLIPLPDTLDFSNVIRVFLPFFTYPLSSIPGNLKTLAKGFYPPSLRFLSFNWESSAKGSDQCTCELCGNDLRDGFCSLCNSRNSCVYDHNLNSFDCPPDSCHPPHPTYETNSCDSYGNDSHFGYDCQPQFPLNYESKPGYIKNYNSYPYDSSSFTQQDLCCENCGFIQKKQEEKQIEEEQAAKAQNLKIPVCYDDEDDEEKSNSLKDNIIYGLTPCFAITPNEPVDSLGMRDEHLNTILAMKSDEFIKCSVENLAPNPSESEGENGCDVPACFTTFSNVLFDADYDFYSVDDQSLSDKDISEKIYSNPLFDEEIISMKIDKHHFNAESDLIESLLNHDSYIIPSSSKIDSLLDEFVGELILLKSIPPRIDKTDCDHENEIHLTKRLLYDNSSPRPPKEFVSENSNDDIKSFSPSHIPIKDSDPFMEEIDLSFTLDDPMLPSIKEDDDDSERDILILEELLDNYSLSLPENESFFRSLVLLQNHQMEKSPDLLSHRGLKTFKPFAKCPMMIHGKNIPILDVPLFCFYPLDQFKYGGIGSSSMT
nr:hypothetical protein [Tanacetum cinerariifolium]